MQRDLLKSRLSKLPQLPALDQSGAEVDDDEAEELRDSFSTSLAPPPPRVPGKPAKDYSPISAAGYFSSALEVDVPLSSPAGDRTATFRVYYTPPQPTEEDQGGRGIVFVCVHGAGYSGLSYAAFGRALAEKGEGKVGVLAYDARGHGKTRLSEEQQDSTLDMSLESMSADLVGLLKSMFPKREEAPSFLLVGHSMGGAVVADACARVQSEVGNVTGITVIDVVEGSALEALSGMTGLVAAQPKGFPSVENAIEWHVRTKTLNNLESARISVPPLLRDNSALSAPPDLPFVWRANLAATEPFWKGWFTGLSSKFLSCRTAKLLLLAGAESLDKELMIGQMQGKYQLEVFPDSGHCVQEDAPDKTADTLLAFWERNDRTDVLRGVKKVGEM
ncbi:Alpha/Beta hydrolase protein [Leucosporidium creatinivorum]|uniref:Protein phosphatase methylesterase 1 n=1 Tax=Leucosporidium creatinivorum TaxID=106004 RepID=A0A1Y2EZ39_9BASI|nr:Alpha/Beta hydrolase protein [Leucosporidium creatinivorum]